MLTGGMPNRRTQASRTCSCTGPVLEMTALSDDTSAPLAHPAMRHSMVGTANRWVGRCRSIASSAAAASKRGSRTSVPPWRATIPEVPSDPYAEASETSTRARIGSHPNLRAAT